MADKFILSVTAGPTYTDQTPVPVNTERATEISSDLLTASLQVRIRNYRGLPRDSPKSSPYLDHAPHTHDLYSLGFSFRLKDPAPETSNDKTNDEETKEEEKEEGEEQKKNERGVNGHDLVFGNDFDHPIRDKLPPGFQQAFNLVKWFIDPGLYGDVHADEPYLYGPLLSSINTFRVGDKSGGSGADREASGERGEEVHVVEEGADGDGAEVRAAAKIPADAAGRKKFFLTEQHQKDFTFEYGRTYENDFFNPYLDFNDFALRLPGFGVIPGITIPIISHWDGQPLRYVLKNRKTNKELFVIVFTLIPKEKVDEKGNIIDSKEESKHDDAAAESAAKEKPAVVETTEDDLD